MNSGRCDSWRRLGQPWWRCRSVITCFYLDLSQTEVAHRVRVGYSQAVSDLVQFPKLPE